LAYERKYL